MGKPASAEFEITFRTAEETDASALMMLRAAFWSDQISKGALDHPDMEPERLLGDTLSQIKRPRTIVILATAREKLIGYILGQTKILPGIASSSVSSIEEVFVATEHRRSTVARQLVERVMAYFEGAGAHRIQLRVLEGNPAAQKFWQGIGFSPAVIIYEYLKINGVEKR